MGKVRRHWTHFHPTAVTYFKAHMGDYGTIILSDRLYAMIKYLGNKTAQEKTENGGFLIKTGIGLDTRAIGVRMVNLVGGEGKEIFLEPHEQLEYGEQYLGTFHSHPLTDVPSIHDVLTFIADPTEKVSIVHGVSGTINLMIKKPDTRAIDPAQLEAYKAQYEKGNMAPLVRDFGFMFFQGKSDTLQRAFEPVQIPLEQSVSLDEISYGIEGSPDFPQQPTKKKPPEAKGYYWSGLGAGYTFDNVLRKWIKK